MSKKKTLILDAKEITKAAEIIKAGGTVAFPTETVYGLGANALDSSAVAKIFKAKNRPPDNPLIVHISSKDMLHVVAKDIPAVAFDLIDRFWPGPLTLVLERKVIVPDITTGGLDTVAVRMPSSRIAIDLIRNSGKSIAAPSANLSGKPSPTTADHVIRDMDGRIDAIIRDEDCIIGVESTVIDMTATPPALLRPGGVSLEEIVDCIGEVQVSEKSVRSPGMRYTHYSPETRLVLVEGEKDTVISKIRSLIQDYHEQGLKVCVLASRENASLFECETKYILGSSSDLKEVANRLFSGLRFLDETGVDIGIVEGSIPEIKEGRAIMNRLRKAAGESICCNW